MMYKLILKHKLKLYKHKFNLHIHVVYVLHITRNYETSEFVYESDKVMTY